METTSQRPAAAATTTVKLLRKNSLHQYLLISWETFLPPLSSLGYPPGTEVWIGANDLAFAGRLVWTDGREVGPYENLHETAYVAATAASRRCLVASLADGRWRRRDCADVTGASVEGRGDPAGPGGEGATEEPPAPTPTAFIAERSERHLLLGG